jgi:hypothetical protein
VRLPPFWAERPGPWFAQAEAQFHLAGITSELTKFYHVVSQLDIRCIAEVEDLVSAPPPINPFTTLKAELIKRLCPSSDQRTRQLFTLEEMGDRKPSQFLRHLRSLAPDIPDNYLRILWTSRLSPNVQVILAGMHEVGLDAAAACADRIVETVSPPAVASASAGPDLTALFETVKELSCQVADLSRQMASLTMERSYLGPRERQSRRPQSNNRRRSSSRGNSGPGGDTNKSWCYYHRRFGNQAQRCTQPCTYSPQGN